MTDNSCRYLHSLFLLDSNKYFFICFVPYMYICLYYFFILCFYFHLFFLTFLATSHIYNLQCLIRFHYNLSVYGCSFAAKISSKKKNFFFKYLCFFTKSTWFAEKKVLYWNNFFREKNIYERVKNINLIWEIFFIQKMFVLQIKYKLS